MRRDIFFLCSQLILLGVLAMRWNVVIGGQLFSKSLRGFTTYKLELIGQEGLFTSLVLLVLPFIILGVLMFFFLPANHMTAGGKPNAAGPTANPQTATSL